MLSQFILQQKYDSYDSSSEKIENESFNDNTVRLFQNNDILVLQILLVVIQSSYIQVSNPPKVKHNFSKKKSEH